MSSALDDLTWPVRTGRLSLRPATTSDAETTWRYRRLPEVTEWMTAASPDPASYRDRFVAPERLAKTLVIELGGVVVGDLLLAVEDAWGQAEVADRTRSVQAEIGWCLDPVHAGRGLATEAAAALVRLCFVDLGLRRVTAHCFAANVASWRLMERLGLRREEYAVEECLHRSGAWMDGLGYALLADEWRRANGAL